MTAWPYAIIGQGKKPPLVLLHGFMGSRADWQRVAASCAEDFCCILPDLPGHGANINRDILQPLRFEDVVEELVSLFDALSLSKVHLAGYSMGGRIALYAASMFPQRIASLVLEGANPGIAEEEARRERARLDDRRADDILERGLDSFVDRWYELELFHTLKQHPYFEQIKARRKQNKVEWIAKVIRELSPGRQAPLWDKLADLPMPVTLVAGTQDAKYVGLVKQMSRQIPFATVYLIPAAGHNTHLEQPQTFARLLFQHFISR